MPNTKHLIELEFAKKFQEWCKSKSEYNHDPYNRGEEVMEEWLSEYFDADNNKEL